MQRRSYYFSPYHSTCTCVALQHPIAFSLIFASSSKNRIYALLVRTNSYGQQQGVWNALAFQVVLVRVRPDGLRLTPDSRGNLTTFDGVVCVAWRVGKDVQRVHQPKARRVLEEGDALQVSPHMFAHLVLVPRENVREGVLVEHALLRLMPHAHTHADDATEQQERQVGFLRPVTHLPAD